jgi:hypothetical protein
MLKYHIQTIEIGSGGATVIDFTSIPQIYDDLEVVISSRGTGGDHYELQVTFNGSTSGYSSRQLFGTGSSVSSSSPTNRQFGLTQGTGTTASIFASGKVLIPNYKLDGVAKSYSVDSVTENNATLAYQAILAGLWAGTAPITSISIQGTSGTFVQFSSASLYGIKRGSDGRTEAAAGGTITTSGGFTYHTFTSSGTFSANRNLTVDVLAVGGGGGGGGKNAGGGGGAGGLVFLGSQSFTSGNYAITVGSGGNRGGDNFVPGANGSNSAITGPTTASVNAVGGGGGGCSNVGGNAHFGRPGGSGGGAGNDSVASGGTPVTGQGFKGGDNNAGNFTGAGGGGAGAAGADVAANNNSKAGGIGVNTYSTWATATSTGDSGYYSGGAAGGGNISAGGSLITTRTLGGGGGISVAVADGLANTGGGGGGFAYNGGGATYPGGNGGSGVVIIRYLTPA